MSDNNEATQDATTEAADIGADESESTEQASSPAAKLKAERDALKQELADLKSRAAKEAADAKKRSRQAAAEAGDWKTLHDQLASEKEAIAAEKAQLEMQLSSIRREHVERSFIDAVVQGSNVPAKARVMLRGLAADGKIDLAVEEDVERHAARARKLLESLDATLYASGGTSGDASGAIPGARAAAPKTKNTNAQMTMAQRFAEAAKRARKH